MEKVKYSIVVPAYNEQESLPVFFKRVIPMFEALGENFEIIVVNDGSADRTEEILKSACEKDKRIKAISFSRNFGQQAAFLCGLKHSRGEAVIAMDADLQDPPEVALEMIEKWKEGYDIVHGRRKKRPGESVFKRVTASVYYKFLQKISYSNVPRNVGDFKLYSRRAVNEIIAMREHDRLLRAQASWIGFNQTFVDFDRPAREVGETKYTLKKMIKLATDGIITNSNFPLTVSLWAGLGLGAVAVILAAILALLPIWQIEVSLVAWLFPFILAMFAIQLTLKGFSDIYTARIYEEVKNRPVYVIKDKLNVEEDD